MVILSNENMYYEQTSKAYGVYLKKLLAETRLTAIDYINSIGINNLDVFVFVMCQLFPCYSIEVFERLWIGVGYHEEVLNELCNLILNYKITPEQIEWVKQRMVKQ